MTMFRRIFIIGFLSFTGFLVLFSTGIYPSVFRAHNGNGSKIRTYIMLKDLTLGIKNYEVEYGHLPIFPGQASEGPVSLSAGSPLLKILLGENEQGLNPHKVTFIEPPMGRDGALGLIGTPGRYSLMDAWGTPYEVFMPAEGAHEIPNPDVRSKEHSISTNAPPALVPTVAARSLGEDKKADTKDDIVSWRQ